MITKKHAIIVKSLSNKDGYMTSNELAIKLDVSTKTIKRYIADLNSVLSKYDLVIASSRGIGYKLSGSKNNIARAVKEANKYIDGFLDDSEESRMSNIICMLINRNYMSIEAMAEELNLSIAAINKLSSKLKRKLEKYDLVIKSKPYYGSYIHGEEINIRQLITDYAIKLDEKSKVKVFLDDISENDIHCIESILEKHLREKDTIISDKDFNLLLSKIIVSVFRSKRGHSNNINLMDTSYRFHNYYFIENLMKEISDKIGFKLIEDEVIYISNYSGVIAYKGTQGRKNTSEIEERISTVISSELQDIFLISGSDYTKDDEFMVAISDHIKRFLNRARANVKSNNPLLHQIKEKFPIAFNLAVFLSNKLETEFNLKLDEDELGYIAIHFAASNERMKKNTSKKICIVCHYGIGTGQLISEKLKQNISDLSVVGVYPVRYLDMAISQDVDLIVSTVELKGYEKPVLYIENIFDDSLIENVNKAFYEKEERRKIISNMFDEKAFFSIKANTKEEVIISLSNKLKERDFIEESSIKSIIDRENISSTEIGNLVAIPHTIVKGDKKSIIGVGILENPIIWDKQEVQLVFMVFFNTKEKHNFSIFKYLYNFIKDEGGVRGIIKICDFNKLMALIGN